MIEDNFQLLRPKFLPLLTPEQCAMIGIRVEKLITILASDDVALDGKHSPALYSRFLASLLEKYYTPALRQNIQAITGDILAQYQPYREQTPPYTYLWPDTVVPVADASGTGGLLDIDEQFWGEIDFNFGHVVRQEAGEAEMDFSPQHFVRSTTQAPGAEAEGCLDMRHMTSIFG